MVRLSPSISAVQTKQNQKLSFGRALTSGEMAVYCPKIEEIRNRYNFNNTGLIIPDFSFRQVPSEDTGIGTLNSHRAVDDVIYMKKMSGVNVVQRLPIGPISKVNLSPFSTSPFEIGDHIICLHKLATDPYNLLTEKQIQEGAVNTRSNPLPGLVDYDNILGKKDDPSDKGTQIKLLKIAYNNFIKLPDNEPIKKEFIEFKNANPYVKEYGLVEALAEEHGTDYPPKWNSELDKNLFVKDTNGNLSEAQQNRINQLNENYADKIDFYQLRQFIANKQETETKTNLNKEGIKVFGDCLIGFSEKDKFLNPEAFKDGWTLGVKDGEILRNWGIPCLDFDKIYKSDVNADDKNYKVKTEDLGPAGRLLKKKFDIFFSQNDGARIDGAWQLIKTFAIENGEGQDIVDNSKVREVWHGNKLLNIMELSIKEQREKGHNISTEDICLEMLGGPGEAVTQTKNKYPHINITRYAGEDWGRPAFYNLPQETGDNLHRNTHTGYNRKGLTIGIGSHDDISLIELEKESNKNQSDLLAKDLNLNPNKLKSSPEEFMAAKLAEPFTTRNQFFTIFDWLGMDKRINNPQNPSGPNWRVRANKGDKTIEEIYNENLQKGTGLNLPLALYTAINLKEDKKQEDLDFLKKAASILRQEGPKTTKEADELDEKGKIREKLEEENNWEKFREKLEENWKKIGEKLEENLRKISRNVPK
jgi:hypothetical protein